MQETIICSWPFEPAKDLLQLDATQVHNICCVLCQRENEISYNKKANSTSPIAENVLLC